MMIKGRKHKSRRNIKALLPLRKKHGAHNKKNIFKSEPALATIENYELNKK